MHPNPSHTSSTHQQVQRAHTMHPMCCVLEKKFSLSSVRVFSSAVEKSMDLFRWNFPLFPFSFWTQQKIKTSTQTRCVSLNAFVFTVCFGCNKTDRVKKHLKLKTSDTNRAHTHTTKNLGSIVNSIFRLSSFYFPLAWNDQRDENDNVNDEANKTEHIHTQSHSPNMQ